MFLLLSLFTKGYFVFNGDGGGGGGGVGGGEW